MPISKKWTAAVQEQPLNPGDVGYVGPETREEFVRKGLARRLKGVCAKLSRSEFDALILKMTREQLRGECINGWHIRPC